MSTTAVFQQMLIIVILIIIGYGAYKKGILGDESARSISELVLTITNPCMIIMCALSDDLSVSHKDILTALLVTGTIYVVLVLFAKLMPYMLRADKSDRRAYIMMCIYNNTGFVGIPVASALLGANSLMYVTFFNIMYTIFFYTQGHMCMLQDAKDVKYKVSVKSFINVGTIAAVITVIMFWYELRFPTFVESTITYAGRSTTFLAMMVLGISFAKLPIKKMFKNVRIYLMILIRYVAFPIVVTIILRTVFGTGIMISTSCLILSMPVANGPLMLAARYKLKTDTLASGIFVSTILSVLTVTLACMVL